MGANEGNKTGMQYFWLFLFDPCPQVQGSAGYSWVSWSGAGLSWSVDVIYYIIIIIEGVLFIKSLPHKLLGDWDKDAFLFACF